MDESGDQRSVAINPVLFAGLSCLEPLVLKASSPFQPASRFLPTLPKTASSFSTAVLFEAAASMLPGCLQADQQTASLFRVRAPFDRLTLLNTSRTPSATLAVHTAWMIPRYASICGPLLMILFLSWFIQKDCQLILVLLGQF